MGLAELEDRFSERRRQGGSLAENEPESSGAPALDEEQRAAKSLYRVRESRGNVERYRPPAEPAPGEQGPTVVPRLRLESVERELERVTAQRDDLARQALRDPLTGSFNRQALADGLGTQLSLAEREGHSVALVALDIDFFKHVNDLCGHAVGDEVLRIVADHLAFAVRPGDVSARVGGDEFTLVLARADAQLAIQVLERIEHAVGELRLTPEQPPLSFSAGIAEFPRDSAELGELMERADEALFWAKARGRHRACVYASRQETQLPTELGARGCHERYLQNTVEALARAVDARNGYTHLHSHAVAAYAVALAEGLGLEKEHVELVRRAAVLHHVGKIGVPDAVLWKEGPLDSDEVTLMRRHSSTGRDILLGAGLPDIARWVGHLHERVDGDGYPDGLTGDEIPFESRLLAVADAFDAMTCRRLYREPLAVEDALYELESGSRAQFDEELVARFVALVRAGALERREPRHWQKAR